MQNCASGPMSGPHPVSALAAVAAMGMSPHSAMQQQQLQQVVQPQPPQIGHPQQHPQQQQQQVVSMAGVGVSVLGPQQPQSVQGLATSQQQQQSSGGSGVNGNIASVNGGVPQQQQPQAQATNQQQPVQSQQQAQQMPPAQQQQQQQSKEFNTASLCRIGQETVQDIVSRTQEVFQTLKAIQLPNGMPQTQSGSNEKKVKVQEQLRTIRVLFKRLRLIYEKCNENCQLQGMEYTHIESLIPFKDEMDPKHEEKKNSEAYRMALEESKEVMEQVVLKNKQLKEVIDHLRRINWEINTMLMMRRS